MTLKKAITPTRLARDMFYGDKISPDLSKSSIILYMADENVMFDVRKIKMEDPFNVFYRELGILMGRTAAREEQRAEALLLKQKSRLPRNRAVNVFDDKFTDPVKISVKVNFQDDRCSIRFDGLLENLKNYEGYRIAD